MGSLRLSGFQISTDELRGETGVPERTGEMKRDGRRRRKEEKTKRGAREN